LEGTSPEAMSKLVLSDGLTPEAMVGRCKSVPDALVEISDDGIAGKEKTNIEDPAPEAMCKINKAEVPGRRKVECLKIHPIAPEAMTEFNIDKDLSAKEAMCKYSKAEKRVAEYSTITESRYDEI
jgi:hypothetical protein